MIWPFRRAPRYTGPFLTDARQAEVEAECRLGGHDCGTVVDLKTYEPIRLICRRCGRKWNVR